MLRYKTRIRNLSEWYRNPASADQEKKNCKIGIKKNKWLKVIKDHLEEFESAKEVLDACHEHEKEVLEINLDI